MAIVSLSHSNLQQCYSQQSLKHSHVNSYILHEQDEDEDKNSNTVGDLFDRYLEERSVFVSRDRGDGEVLLNILRCQLTY